MSGITIQGGDRANGGGIFVDPLSTLNLSDATFSQGTTKAALEVVGPFMFMERRISQMSCYLETQQIRLAVRLAFTAAVGPARSPTSRSLEIRHHRKRRRGIWNDSVLTVTNSTITGNSALRRRIIGGGIFNDGTLTLIDTAISGNSAEWGAGIYNTDTMTLERVTIDGNMSSNNGGGIYNDFGNTVSLTNVTISGNTSGNNGGGIFTNSSIDITNSTIASNLPAVAEFSEQGAGDAVLKNTILANNVGGNANRHADLSWQ